MSDDPKTRSGRRARPHVTGRTKALIIDDSEVGLELMRDALERAGFEVITRQTAVGAQALILRERPRVVLLDVEMPLMTGGDLAKAIRSNEALRETRVFLYSSRGPSELDRLVQESGAHGWFEKEDVDALASKLLARISYTASSPPRALAGRGLLFACATSSPRALGIELCAIHTGRLTDSGTEALRLMLSRQAPAHAILGTGLADLTPQAIIRAATARDASWMRRVILLSEDGGGVEWETVVPLLPANASVADVEHALSRLYRAA